MASVYESPKCMYIPMVYITLMGVVLVMFQVHLVVNGVPKSEDGQHGDDDGRRRGVLAIKVARLDAAPGRLWSWALWELGVERDEGAQVGALPRREN